jgi:hypothetical protein
MDRGARFKAAALALSATYPWSIIPIRSDEQGHKRAACKWEQYQRRRPSADEIKKVFSRRDPTGLAVILGAVSGGLYGRDFDVLGAFHRWAAQYSELAARLPTVKTSRGFHVYAYSPEVVQTKDLGDGEVRGEGSYLLLPPSIHRTGKIYAWVVLPRRPCPEVTIAPDAAGLSRSWLSDDTPREQRDRESENPRVGESESRRARGGGGCTSLTLVDVIQESLPKDFRQNHDRLFNLARGVRALEKTEGRVWNLRELEERVFAPWYEQNRHLNPEQTRAQYLNEFLMGYDLVRHPLGEGMLEATWAQSATCEPPAVAREFASPHLRRVVTWCLLLQRAAGNEPFFLSVRSVQGKLGLGKPQRASAILRRLVDAGILTEVEKGGPSTNRATRFRYLLPV